MEEIWKDIEGYDGVYQISTFGRVRKKVKTKNGYDVLCMRPSKAKGEEYYYIVKLSKDNKKTTYFIHRLVAQAFIPNPDKLPQVNHKDENKLNNNVENLEWCTAKYNVNYGRAIEKMKDSLINNPKLCKIVYQFDLKGNLVKSYLSIKQASKETGINKSSIGFVCRGLKTTAGGFIWSFDNNKDKIKFITEKIINSHTEKPVLQLDLNNNLIKKWKSATVAAKELGLKRNAISYCCHKNTNKCVGGFLWRFDL